MKSESKIASFFNALFVNHHQFSPVRKIEKVVARMTLAEKIFFYFISLVVVISSIIMVLKVNDYFMVEVPAFGGSFAEGVIGNPRFINPVLALSDADKDLTSLIYSGLLKASESGGYEPNLAKSYTVSADGTAYDFVLKNDVYFHDGKKVTADDVIFTVAKVLDPVVKSPREALWEGVTVQKISDSEVMFVLNKPYVQFIQALTLGILPKHIWENVSPEEFPFSDFNINPVGSGPYKVQKVSRNSGGIPTQITLGAWNRYALGRPKIKNITFKFFQDENSLLKALASKSVDSATGLSQAAAKNLVDNKTKVDEVSLPRVFGVFFNQNVAPVFLNKEARVALDMAAPKQTIVNNSLLGFGKVLNGPTPANIETNEEKLTGNAAAAKDYLLKNGWKENSEGILEKKTKTETVPLKFSISTSDAPELKTAADILKNAWNSMGAQVEVKVFEAGDLSQNVIKSRKYDALLFGEAVGEDSDLYPFWHSSERNDPGLNISIYTNISVDKALENLQVETDAQKIADNKATVFSEIQNDMPAVFLFSPDFLYVPASKVKNISFKNTSFQNERFLSVNKWNIETDKVWKIFEPQK